MRDGERQSEGNKYSKRRRERERELFDVNEEKGMAVEAKGGR